MKKSMLYTLSFLLLLLSSCCKEGTCDPPVDPCDLQPCNDTTTKLMGKLDTLWTAEITGVTGSINNYNMFIDARDVIVVGSGSTQAFLAKYNTQRGDRDWIWISEERSFPTSHLNKTNIILQNEVDIYSVSAADGNLIKHFTEPTHGISHSYGQLIDEQFYFTIRSKNNEQAWLIRSNADDLQTWDTIYTLKSDASINNNRPNIQSYNLWIHPETRDSILIFQHRMLDRVDVVAWNMDKREVVWRHDDITPNGNSNHQQIFIYEDKAYFGGSVSFFCFDMKDGRIVWRYDDTSGQTPFMNRQSCIAESISSIIVAAGGRLIAFDLSSGSIRWNVENLGDISSGSPIYHKGIIYRTMAGLLSAVRATNGSLLWSERSSRIPMGRTSFQGELAIDPERGILYATDDDELFAIKVYED